MKNHTMMAPQLTAVLERLYAEAKVTDGRLMPQIKAEIKQQGVMDDRKITSLRHGAFMAVSPEVGRFLYSLVRMKRPQLVVEFGTSMGISAIHIAAGLRDNGFGRLITAEQDLDKVQRAGHHLAEAGLTDLVEIRGGDAFQTLAEVRRIDLLMLDGWKALYLPLLQQLEPHLSPECVVVADDTTLMPEMLAGYLSYVRDPVNGYVSTAIPMDDGVELSIR